LIDADAASSSTSAPTQPAEASITEFVVAVAAQPHQGSADDQTDSVAPAHGASASGPASFASVATRRCSCRPQPHRSCRHGL
jgi:hypothetical protein